MRRSDLRGAAQALGHLALVAATGAATVYLFSQQLWLAGAGLLFLHGTFSSFLSSGAHELDHGTVFRTRWLNRAFLRVYSLLSWFNFHDYALSHTYHHRYTLHPDGDREVELPKTPSLRAMLLLQLFTVTLFGSFEAPGIVDRLKLTTLTALRRYPRTGRRAGGRATAIAGGGEEWVASLYAAHPEEYAKSVRWARLMLGFHLLVLVATVLTQLWVLPLVASFPTSVARAWRYLVGMPMHTGLRDNVADFRKCVRTIKLDPLSEFLYWHMNWHMEHHMYAGVPCYRLAELSRVIADDLPEPRSLLGAWREMRGTWRRQRTDPSYQYDTPVPTPARSRTSPGNDELQDSIGDLAPPVLTEP